MIVLEKDKDGNPLVSAEFTIIDLSSNPYICTSCKEMIYDRDELIIHECKEIKSPFDVHKHIFWE